MQRKLALIIGNSEYQDENLTRLKAPEVDVASFAQLLRDPSIGGFDEVNEIVNPSFGVVLKEIYTFFSDKKSDDLLLLYFSGHGVQDPNGRLYFAVNDTKKDMLQATAVPSSYISERLKDCRSRRKILILDCCHSGAWQVGAKGQTTAVTAETFQGYAHVVMTASDKTELAQEGHVVVEDVSLSLFTNYLLEGLRTGLADRQNDGWIDVEEWFDYARDEVVSRTSKQTPKIWLSDTQGELRIARNPNPKAVTLPQRLETSINSGDVKVRMQAIEELGELLQGSMPALATKAAEALGKMAASDDSNMVRQRAAEISRKGKPGPPPDEAPGMPDEDRHLNALYSSALSAIQLRLWGDAQHDLLAIEKEEAGYKDVRRLLDRVSAEVRQIQATNLAAAYGQAMQYINAQDWNEAQRLFRQIEHEEPDYRDVRQQLGQVEIEIRRQQAFMNQQHHLATIYGQAMQAIQAEQWIEAQRLLQQLERETPGYRDVQQRLAEANKRVIQNTVEQQLQRKLDDLYERALQAINLSRWTEAHKLLQQIQVAKPLYRDVPNLIMQVKQQLPAQRRPAEASGPGKDPYHRYYYRLGLNGNCVYCQCFTAVHRLWMLVFFVLARGSRISYGPSEGVDPSRCWRLDCLGILGSIYRNWKHSKTRYKGLHGYRAMATSAIVEL